MQVLSPLPSRSPSPISDADTDPGSFNYLSIPVATAPSLTEVSPIWDRHRPRSPSMERSNSGRSLSPPEIINISPPSSANSTKAPSPTPAQSRVFSPSVGRASVLCSPAPSSLRSLSPYVGPSSPVIRSIAPSVRSLTSPPCLPPITPVGSAPQSPAGNVARSILYSTHSSTNSLVQPYHRPAPSPKIPSVMESSRFSMNSGSPLTPPSEPILDRALPQGSYQPSYAAVSERSLTPPPEPIPYRTFKSNIQPIPYRTWVCRPTKRQDDMWRYPFAGPSKGNNPTKPIRHPWGPPPQAATHLEPSSPLSQTVSPSTSSGADSYFPCSPGLFGPRSPPPLSITPGRQFDSPSPLPPPPVPVQWKMTLPTPPPASHPSYQTPWSIYNPTAHCRVQPPVTVLPVPSSYNASAAAAATAMNTMNPIPGYTPAKTHERFYFPDGTAWIRVKNVDYKVHRHFLTQHSSFFRTQYEGTGIFIPVTPLSLPTVDPVAFELVLSIFYPKDPFSGHDIHSPAQWAAVLRFACEYDMPTIKEMALSKVAALSPLDRVELAKQCKLGKEIMVPGFVDLFMDDVVLSKEDGKKVGWEGLLVLKEVKREVEGDLKAFLDREKVKEAVEKKLGEMGLLD